jgi:hypothetical protein
MKKSKLRISILITILLVTATYGVDYFLAVRIENLIKDYHPAKELHLIEIEADTCAALTGKTLGPHFFTKKVISKYIQDLEIVRGDCRRGHKSDLRLSLK